MGMFGFFKKNKVEDVEATEGGRFTLMVEDAFLLKDKNGVVVTGVVHGEIKVGNIAYVSHHTRPMTEVKVKAIEIGKDQGADSAYNQRVALLLDGVSRREDVPKFTILSGMKPQSELGKDIENPMMLGLSMEYVNCARDAQYLNTLIYAACHSHFITPVKIEGENVGFTGVTSPEMTGIRIFPIFTDSAALNINPISLEQGEKNDTMVLAFPNVVEVVNNGYAGAVINPYGPVPVFFPMNLIEHITTLDGYKKEFGK